MAHKLLLVALFCFLNNDVFAQSEYKVMAVGFYNCENLFDTIHDARKKDEDFTPNGSYHYTSEVYKQKLHNIATVFQKLGTDVTPDGAAIVGMAEVENDQVLKDLVEQPELKGRHYKYVWFYTPDERGISTAMIYSPKYLKILTETPIHVPTEKLPAKRTTRDILHVYGILAGDTVHILVNHWPSKFGGEASSEAGRKLAATMVKNTVDTILQQNPESKILIMGDFNDNPTSDGIVNVINAKAEKSDVGLTDIYNPWIKMYKKGLGTENYHEEWNLIDQIMISGSLLKNDNNKWKYYKHEIYSRDFLINRLGRNKGLPHRSFTMAHTWDNGYSDHFPVLMYLVEKK